MSEAQIGIGLTQDRDPCDKTCAGTISLFVPCFSHGAAGLLDASLDLSICDLQSLLASVVGVRLRRPLISVLAKVFSISAL